MNDTVRYKLNGDARYLLKDDGTNMPINHLIGQVILVDILELMEFEGICKGVKVKLFYPDGKIETGSVVGFAISLHNKDALFDGRFNSTQL